MAILSFISDHDLAGFIMSLAGQSILVSLIGIAVIRLLSRRSAPVRSLVCTATMAALSLIFVIFLGYRLYDADFTQYEPAGVDEREITERIIIPPPVREVQLPIEQLPVVSPSPSSVSFHELLPDSGDIVINQTVSAPYSLSVPLKEQAIIFINALGIIWLLGVLFQVLRLGYGLTVVKRFKGSLEPVKDASFNNMLSNIAVTLFRKGRLVPRLYRSSLIESPMAIGFIHPAIIIPEKLFTTLTDNELKSILLHEMAHIYHYDQVTGIIKRFIIAFHWWNPFVYIINKEHEQAREEVSDNYVLNELSPGDYSRCLMNLAEKVSLISNIPFASGMAGRGFNLIKRVEQILSNKRSNAMNTRLSLKTIVFVCLAVLTFSLAGIHARVKSVEPNNEVEEIKEPLPVINPVEISKDDQTPIKENIPEPKAVNESDMLLSTQNAMTATQKELPGKQAHEQKEPVIVMASIDTKAMNKIEKSIDSVNVQLSDKPASIKDQTNNILLTQNETAKEPDLNSATVPDNAVQNVVPEKTANDTKKEDIDTAIADLNSQIELNDSDAGLYILRGNLYMDKEDYEKAVNDYTKAIEIHPDEVAAYNNRGQSYANMGETKQAIRDYKKAIKIDPENIYAYINRGNAYYERQSYRKAISDYTRAIEIDPEFSLAYINRGIAYHKSKSLSKAINDFSKALELDNRDAETYLLRSNAYYSKGEYMQAINDCSKVLEINPDFIDAYNNRGMAYEGMGDFDKAILDYSKAIKIASKDPDAYFNRKLISTQKTRTNRAGMAIPIWSIRKGGLYPYDDYKDRYPKIADEYSSLWEYSDPFMNRWRLYIKTGQPDKAANNFKTIEHFMMSKKLKYEKDKHMAKPLKPDYSLLEAEAKKEFEALMGTRIQSKTHSDCTNCDVFELSEENRRRLGY